MRIKRITIKDVELVAHQLAQKTMSWTEPIPDFGTRFENALERSIETPFQSFGKRDAYPGLIKKAAMLFYLMIKNHPFQNGNKRVAMTTLFCFLYINKKWLEVDSKELYNFAKWVAASNAKLKDATINAIQDFLKHYIVDSKVDN